MKSRIEILIERLAVACTARGRKAALARHCAVTPSQVSEWLAGREKPGAENILAILEWLAALK